MVTIKISILTANDPGAFRAAVQLAPLYKPIPSSLTILTTPRPLKASGFVWRLIFKTSRGKRTISPMPIKLLSHQCVSFGVDAISSTNLPAVACMMALPFPFPKALSKASP